MNPTIAPLSNRRVAALLLALAGLLGCGSAGVVQSGFGETAPLTVVEVTPRGEFIDVRVEGDGISIRAFVPDVEACRLVFVGEKQVVYRSRVPGGRFTREGETCDGNGLGDPFVSRVNQPRGGGAGTIPRAQASFAKVYEDQEVIFLRGLFPLLGRVGWAGGADTVVVVQNTPNCRGPADRGVASIEFRASGRNTLALVGPRGLCRIDGMIKPLPPAA